MEERERNINDDEKEIKNENELTDTNEQEQSKTYETETPDSSVAASGAPIDASAEGTSNKGGESHETSTENDIAEEASPSADAELVPSKTEEEEKPVSAEEAKEPIYHWNYESHQEAVKKKGREKRKNGAFIYAVVMTCAFITAFAILAVLLLTNDFAVYENYESNGSEKTVEKVVYVRDNTNGEGALSTQEIYTSVLPSVVSISVYSDTGSAIGSGFITTSDGYIVTANHVVDGMSKITVILNSGEKYDATLVGGNAFTDLALLKIDATGLPAAKLGSSEKLLVGDKVFAIGTPAALEYAGSMTEGIVSYNGRVVDVYNDSGAVEKKMTLIQTDALVNPGNSGCPLINAYGEIVGIVTMKLNSTYYDAICFAIPTDSAMPIINAMKDGSDYSELLSAVSRYPAKLGISAKDVALSGQNIYGVEISAFASTEYDISKKMKIGDVIVKIDDTAVTCIQDISDMLDKYEPGDTIKISFYRSSQLMSVNVVLGK